MDYQLMALLVVAAFCCELIDSSMGMLYGTILSPTLILMGFPPTTVVPAILLSQGMGGLAASVSHHKNGNADFSHRSTADFKAVALVGGLGIIATIAAVFVAVKIPKVWLQGYIGSLVAFMGVMLLLNMRFSFTWGRMAFVAVLSAFNKSLSGGGYGPIVTSGQVIAGRGIGQSVGVTTAAEVPITMVGFITYLLVRGIDSWAFIACLCLGATVAGPIGARLTAHIKEKKAVRPFLGALTLALGIMVLVFRISA